MRMRNKSLMEKNKSLENENDHLREENRRIMRMVSELRADQKNLQFRILQLHKEIRNIGL
jgi:FtsZ-binding cell division protein ZapB